MSKDSYTAPSHLTRRGIGAVTALTGIAAGGLVWAASGNGTPAPKSEPQITCEVPVKSEDTRAQIAERMGMNQTDYSSVAIYRGVQKESNPDETMQAGDTAVARIGKLACQDAGGMPGDPNHAGVVIE